MIFFGIECNVIFLVDDLVCFVLVMGYCWGGFELLSIMDRGWLWKCFQQNVFMLDLKLVVICSIDCKVFEELFKGWKFFEVINYFNVVEIELLFKQVMG